MRHKRHHAADAVDDFIEGDDDLRRPQTAFFERHELDETHHDIFFAGETGESLDFVIVESAKQNAVDFERSQACVACRANSGDHLVEASGNARDAFEGRSVYCVHADGDAIQAGGLEGLRPALSSKMTVGGEREVERLAVEVRRRASSSISSTRPCAVEARHR